MYIYTYRHAYKNKYKTASVGHLLLNLHVVPMGRTKSNHLFGVRKIENMSP